MGFTKKVRWDALKGEWELNAILQKLAGFSAKDWLLIFLIIVVAVGILPKIIKRLANQGEALDAPGKPQYLGMVRSADEHIRYSIAFEIRYEDAYGRKCTGKRLAHHTRIAKRAESMLRLLVAALSLVNQALTAQEAITANQAYYLIYFLTRRMIDHFANHNGVALSVELLVGINSARLLPTPDDNGEETHEDPPPQTG